MATSSDPKIPLRGIADLFDHLDPGVKAKLKSAFGEAEDLMDYHNLSTIDKQQRRKLSGLVDSPVLTSTTNNRGFDVQWGRLDDRRISSYEVQVSFSSNFANPDTYNVVDTSLSLEGIGTTVYVRVRGIRFNGDCGPFSDPLKIDALATNPGPVVYSRGFNDVPSFYIADPASVSPSPIQHLHITPQRQNGGIMVFGSFGVAGPFPAPLNIQAGDSLLVRLNDTVLSLIDLGSFSSHALTFIGNDTYPFSVGFGPTFLTHDEFYFSAADALFPATATQTGTGTGTHTGWTNLANATGTMETDYSGASATDYLQTGISPGQSLGSKHLKLTKLGFNIPNGNTINGIEASFTGGWFGGDPTKSNPFVGEMSLIDDTGSTRTFSQSTTFPWPGTGTFDLASQPASGAIPFVTFGDPTDLWGESSSFWTPAKINDPDFGVDIIAKLRRKFNDIAGDQRVWLYGMTMTVFSTNVDLTARIDVVYRVAAGAGQGGTLTNLTLNVIEFGQSL